MCGIAGAIDLKESRDFTVNRLLAMTNAIQHRGPDDESFHIAPGIAIAARRLAIMDIENGRQPLTNETGSIWTAFNGQVFNYPRLRQELLAREHQLRTNCDSEVWAHLYEDSGVGMFERAEGQFAVSLWDSKEQTLILGRDRVGICPLYYAERDGWFLWGSEIKALLASGLVRAAADPKGIDYLFNFYCAGNRRTFFDDIHLLPAGHYLRIKNKRVEVCQYWDLDFPNRGEERYLRDPKSLIDEFDGLLTSAVQKRLQGDVPVVSYLSGGIDSTMILNIGSRLQPEGMRSFTMGMDRRIGSDEEANAAVVANMLGSKMTTVPIDKIKIAEGFPALIIAGEGPVLDTSCAALMQLAAEVHNQGYKVALTGEGADEALAGYFWFKAQKLSGKIGGLTGSGFMPWMRKLMQNSIHSGIPRGIGDVEHAILGVRPAQQYIYETARLTRETLYSEEMWTHLHGHNPYMDIDIAHDRIKDWHPLNQSLYVGYKVMLPGLLLMSKGDRVSMRSSVETRYPFLDEDLIRFCASIDPSYKLRRMKEKWILRQVAARTLPRKIANRPKTMFRSVLSEIFLGPHRPYWVDQLLSPESLQRSGYFNPVAVLRERALQVKYPRRVLPRQYIFDAALTCVITTQLWHHLFCGGNLCDLPVWDAKP
jgi:asparagine synthase (glutamine-hydrolysing)